MLQHACNQTYASSQATTSTGSERTPSTETIAQALFLRESMSIGRALLDW